MTRKTVNTGGRSGVAGEIYPEQTREIGRVFGLKTEATILRFTEAQDDGGAPDNSWVPDDEPVLANLQPLTTRATGRQVASQVDESASHIVSFRAEANVDVKDRFLMNGETWLITSNLERDEDVRLIDRFGARQNIS